MNQQSANTSCTQKTQTPDIETNHDALTKADRALHGLVSSYRESDDLSKIQEMVSLARQTLAITIEGTEQRPMWLHALAWSLYQKYKHIEADGDCVQEASSFERKARDASPIDSADFDKYSYWLGLQLGDLFFHSEDISDLNESIALTESSLHRMRDGNPSKVTHQLNLGVLLKEKYNRIGDEVDFLNAAKNIEEALALATDEHHDRSMWNEIFAELYDLRHRNLRLLDDLEKIVQLRHESLSAIENNDESAKSSTIKADQEAAKPTHQFNLALSLDELYVERRSLGDLQESIAMVREAIAAIPEEDPDWLILIRFLYLRLHSLYLETGVLEDLEESISLNRQFIEKGGEEHPDMPAQLNNISVNLMAIFERTGDPAQVDESIRYGLESLRVVSKDDPGYRLVLSNLATALSVRARVTGSLVDLDDAIFYGRSALNATSEEDPDRHVQFHNLASALLKKYNRSYGDMGLLHEAIKMSRKALSCVSDDHPDRETYQNRLASALSSRYDALKLSQGLEESIKLSRDVARAMTDKYTGRTSARGTFAILLQKQVRDGGGSLDDVNEAIEISQKALDLTPEDSPSRTEHWTMLGGLYVSKYTLSRLHSYMETAVEYYRSAVTHPTGDPLRRVIAATAIVHLCPEFDQAYEIGLAALDMVPMLASVRSLETADRQYLLSHAAGLAANTAGAALRIEKKPSEALSILEQGRGLLASSLDEIRTDIKDLQNSFPELADEFVKLRSELDSSDNSSSKEKDMLNGRRRHDAGKAFDYLLNQIRLKPGFEDFLGPLTTDQMLSAAARGPVVVINSSWMGIEAIIIQEEKLSSLAFENKKEYNAIYNVPEHDYGSPETLELLWNSVMDAILKELGFTETPSKGQEWPHVWWIPTGHLSRFPIHAAGLHRQRSGETVMDRVISSYSPSVKALVHGRRRRRMTPKGPAQALLVAMEQTQNQAPLPKAMEEVELVSKICDSMGVKSVVPGSSKQDALDHLRSSKIFHFAGHGYTDSTNPSKSHLCFGDVNDPLTVANLLELNLHEESPFLAYLSACSTGRVQDEDYIDESIHLISACQLAGFRHIIGTLWRVQDEHCVDVARITYETIKEEGMTDDSVCRGLHKAMRLMRDAWLEVVDEDEDSASRTVRGNREARDIISCEDDSVAPAYWVPYVHFGI
ncbi:hypothetical protein FCULG_00006387 [Fusarium culmorum]|uniref:CHAT domain-containing protein n=1 Tax=Fusarium culmorum TaxID=5516 RepID=A0A2T4GTU0_FUSCU|nr:hypothetical protein FCULG_00006387 [Fusarium culmorum]